MEVVLRSRPDDCQPDAVFQRFTRLLLVVRQPYELTAPLADNVGDPGGQVVEDGVDVEFRGGSFHDLARKVGIHWLVVPRAARFLQDSDQFFVKPRGVIRTERSERVEDIFGEGITEALQILVDRGNVREGKTATTAWDDDFIPAPEKNAVQVHHGRKAAAE